MMKLTGHWLDSSNAKASCLATAPWTDMFLRVGSAYTPREAFFWRLKGGCFPSPGLMRDQLNEDFHLKAQTTRISKLPAFQG